MVTLYASPGGGSMGQYSLQKGKFKLSRVPDSENWSSSYFKYMVTDSNTGLTGYLSTADYLKLDSLDTGGYTGSWGTDGKLAMLHQKELVLNPDDTTNFLASLEILREIMSVIDLHSAHA
jgi:hypothetical protein